MTAGASIDQLVWTAVFGQDAELRGTARCDRPHAGRRGGHPAGVDPRSVSGDGPRRSRRLHGAGDQRARDGVRHGARGHPLGQEAERRRVHLRDRALGNRLHRAAAARVRRRRPRRGAARRVHAGRSSSRAITSRPTRRSTTAPTATRSSTALRALIQEEIAAGFYNIDIDTSTLVDLDKPTLDEQQEVNVNLAADFAAFIRAHEPQGVTVSVGGEIGEVGGKNSDVHELHAYMDGFNAELKKRGARPGRPQQDQRADRHRARRLHQRRRHACGWT